MEKEKMRKSNKIGLFFKKCGQSFMNLLFPEDIKCLFCGSDIPNFDDKPYCDECEKVLPFNDGHRCLICDEPIDNEANVCDSCQKNKRFFVKAFCPFVYKGLVRKAILNYKDKNKRYMAKSFAKFIANTVTKTGIKFDYISFVPMTKKKEKERSFNQSKLLAKELGKLLELEVKEVFEKTKDGRLQKNSTFKERQENIVGMYKLKDGVKLKNSDVVLIVDDIITTCATINYCSGLIVNKVAGVYVAAIARNKLRIVKDNKSDPLVPF
ncbi:MAG: ComF family protein [Clostridia bacterium]|nr:ComF family protein [Clostridia bacterium]